MLPQQAPARPPRMAAAIRAGLFPWVPVCLSVGIALWFTAPHLPDAREWTMLAALCAAMLAVPRIAMRRAEAGRIGWRLADILWLAAAAILLAGIGWGLAGFRATQVAAPALEWRYYGPIEGRVVAIDRSGRDRMRLTLDRVRLRDLAPQRTPDRLRLSLMGDHPLPDLGQRVMTTGHLGPPPGPASPGSFDFRLHAFFERLGAVGYVRGPVLATDAPEGGLWWAHRARMAVSRAIRDRIGGQEGAVAAALMTGDRSGISNATNEVMRASNLYHIISISGLHMGMLASFVYGAARLVLVAVQATGHGLGRPLHKIAAGIALAAAAGYLWLSGGGVATERAFVMVAVMLTAIIADQRAISLRTVALAATIILIATPEALTGAGFQMSFAATIALILTFGPWQRMAHRVPGWARPVAMLVLSSVVAGLATSPIAAAHFNRMAQYGLLANLAAVPVMGSLVMPAGVIGAVLAPLGLEAPALWVMGIGTAWILRVAEFVAGLDGAVTMLRLPPGSVVPLMGYGAVLAILCWRQRLRGWHLAGCAAGMGALISAFPIWAASARPDLLIAPEGEAAGLMTPAGRAVSKPSGGGFVIGTWLQEDADDATQETAAARPGWSGERNARMAELPHGWRIWHMTGKGAADRARAACGPDTIVVADEAVDLADPACLLLDLRHLRGTGAVAITLTEQGPGTTPTPALSLWPR